MLYANIIYAILLLFLFIRLRQRRYTLFNVFVFLLPFQSWFYNVGLTLYAFQFAILLMIMKAVFVDRNKVLNVFRFKNKYIVAFLIYAILSTVIISNFYIENFMNVGGYFRSEGRYIAQLILFVLMFSVIPISFIYLKSIDDIIQSLKIYLLSLLVLSALGWIQFTIFNVLGIDIFPIGIAEDDTLVSGVWDGIYRISSLGGDPKAFSLSLIIGFFIIYLFNRNNICFFKYDYYLKYFILITAFATFSTSGIVMFSIVAALVFAHTIFSIKTIARKGAKRKIISIIILLLTGLLIIENLDFIDKVIQERIINREITREDFDAPILTFLSKFPEYLLFGSGLGNIHNFAFPYIRLENLYYMEGNIFVAKSGYLRIISELGLVGFTLLVLLINSVYRNLKKLKKSVPIETKKIISSMQLLLLVVLISYFSRSYVFGELILIISLANVFGNAKFQVLDYQV